MFGYHGRYLRVDLSSGQSQHVALSEATLRSFLGGSGLGAWLLLTEGGALTDALAPDSPLAFVFSPLVGSPLTTSAKFAVVAKSPLTNRFNDSLASSGFALAGKRTGADAIVLVGEAARPVVVVIDEGRVRLDPAGNLWGLSCQETERQLQDRYGRDYQFAVIGPAGERQVRYATISHDGRHAGRGGHGAVLGAKRVKGVAVRGSQRCEWAHPAELASRAKRLSADSLGPATAKYRELGTATNLTTFNRLQALPTRNFQQSQFSEAERLAPESLTLARGKIRASCAACTIGCEHIYQLHPSGKEALSRDGGEQGVRLEYENLFALGSLCGIEDPQAVLEASLLCDQLGLDTISTGGTLAFAMECAERGLLDAPWLRFGRPEALLRGIREIGMREGLGDLLADGSRRLAGQLGGEALDFAPQVKGLEIPGYEPRALQTMALGFAVGSRGADHNRSGAYEADFSDRVDRRHLTPEGARYAIETEDQAAIMDSLILCKFLRRVFGDFFGEAAEVLGLVTGWEVTAGELRSTSGRIVAAKKLFNIRAGWTPAEDTLPARFLTEATTDAPTTRLSQQALERAIVAYNQGRGWTEEGWIPTAQLEEIGFRER
jgi:aldehyde:ferredoxin oxidoreductase